MNRLLMSLTLMALLLGVFSEVMLVHRWQSSVASANPSTDKEIEQLVEKLGNARFEEREEAKRKLSVMEEAIPFLRKALKSSDLEVRRCAADILAGLERRRALRILEKAKTLGKEGRGIEMVDRLVYWSKWDSSGEGWSDLTRFTSKLIDSTSRDIRPDPFQNNIEGFPVGDFRRYVDAIHPKEVSGQELLIRPKQAMIVRGEHVVFGKKESQEPEALIRGILLASEDAEVCCSRASVIVTGGDLKVDSLAVSLIICDGDVEISRLESGYCIIVARGKVTHRSGPIRRCLVRSENCLIYPDGKKIEIKAGTPDPLAFVKFFELADVGITAEDLPPHAPLDAKGVRLKEVRKDSPFASALRVGDVITALEQKQTPTTEIFRRVLRRKLAEDEPIITFTVLRSGKTLDVPIPMKD